jgi:hypothetical protein
MSVRGGIVRQDGTITYFLESVVSKNVAIAVKCELTHYFQMRRVKSMHLSILPGLAV